MQDPWEQALNEIADENKRIIKQSSFSFKDIVYLDDRSVQLLLGKIDYDALVLVLYKAEQNVLEKVLKNKSKRAKAILMEDLKDMSEPAQEYVNYALSEILTTIEQLSEQGLLSKLEK